MGITLPARAAYKDPGPGLLHRGRVGSRRIPSGTPAEVGNQVFAAPHQADAVAGRSESAGGQDACGRLAQRDDGTGRERLDRRGIRCHREHDDRAGQLGQGGHVVVVPGRSGAVDPDDGPGGVESTYGADNLVPGSLLVLRGNGVLEVEDHRIARGGCLAEPVRAVTRAEQQRGTSQGGRAVGHALSSPPRLMSWAAMTLRWISLVPSPTIISGASRK